MSVIVKGMEMPKDCFDCPLCNGENGRCNILGITVSDYIPKECPLVEVRHGKWVERKVIEDGKKIKEWQSAKCSVCGKYHTTPYLYNFDDFDYCPNCGVDFRKGKNDA